MRTLPLEPTNEAQLHLLRRGLTKISAVAIGNDIGSQNLPHLASAERHEARSVSAYRYWIVRSEQKAKFAVFAADLPEITPSGERR